MPAYVRGQAYLAAGDGAPAAPEFQKVIDHPGVVLNSPIGALSTLQLARAFRLAGNTARAKAALDQFFANWKDADPALPVLQEAKSENARDMQRAGK